MRLGLVAAVWLGAISAAVAADAPPEPNGLHITTTKDGKVFVNGKPATCRMEPQKVGPPKRHCVIAFMRVVRYPGPKAKPNQ